MYALMDAQYRADQYRDLGLELPAEVTRLMTVIDAAQAATFADPMAGIDFDKLTAANVAKALREAALTRAVRAGMQEMAGDVQQQLGRRVNAAFAADIDRIIGELRPRFLEAAAVVTQALAAGLTRAVYADGSRVINAGPEAAGLFHKTRDSLASLTRMRSILLPSRASEYDVATFITLTDGANLDTLDMAQQIHSGHGDNVRWLELYDLVGVEPAVNTADEARAVVARAAALRKADAEARKAEQIALAQKHQQAWDRLEAKVLAR